MRSIINLKNNLIRSLRLKLATVKVRYYDLKLGIDTRERACALNQDTSLYGDMLCYSATFYGRLQRMVRYLKLTPNDVFVDLGCGKGRAVFFVATRKLKKVIGVELDKNLFSDARRNLENLKIKKTPIEFINTDAAKFDLSEATVIFMFNPFGYKTFERVLNNIKESLRVVPRNIRIGYYAPAYKALLDSQDWLVREGKIENEHCLVWRNRLISP